MCINFLTIHWNPPYGSGNTKLESQGALIAHLSTMSTSVIS